MVASAPTRSGKPNAAASSAKAASAALGLALEEISLADQQIFLESYGVPLGTGARISSVALNGGSAAAGLWQGDYLIAINGVPITKQRTAASILSSLSVGQRIAVEIRRGGYLQSKFVTLTSPLDHTPDPSAVAPALKLDVSKPDPAFEVMEPTKVDAAVDALGLYLSGIWLETPVENAHRIYYKFSWDSLARTLSWETGKAGGQILKPETVTLQQLSGGRAFKGANVFPGMGTWASNDARRKIDFRLLSPTILVSDLHYMLGNKKYPQRVAISLLKYGQMVLYHRAGEGFELSQIRHFVRIEPGDPDGALARAWGAGNAWLAQWRADRAAEERSRKARGGSNGLFGALAMATGAAVAGGNVEMIYGAALKGAEMTTTNEGLRSGLAGQGDAMIDAGAQRMTAERAFQSQGRASLSGSGASDAGAASGSSAPTRPGAVAARAPAAAPASRTVRMVLIAGILPTDADQKGPNGFGRNPNCQSNIITATIRDDRGSNVPVEELFNQYRANFLAKCQRLGTVSTGPTYEIEYPHSTRFGQTGWNDRLVTLP